MTRKARSRPAAAAPSAPAFAPVPVRARHDGWTPERQLAFLDALAQSGCVHEACRTVGISRKSAYALRQRVDAQSFRMAWDAALDLAVRRLSDECFSRALNGVAVPHFYQGEQIGEHRRYDNRLAMFLLRYRDPLRYAATLDRMVYSGHPEAAALAYAKARDRAADAAEGVAAEPADPHAGEPPFAMRVVDAAEREAKEQAIIEGTMPIHGNGQRRRRLEEARRAHRARTRPERQAAADAEAAKIAAGLVARGLPPLPIELLRREVD